jgi:hypothetical protein
MSLARTTGKVYQAHLIVHISGHVLKQDILCDQPIFFDGL